MNIRQYFRSLLSWTPGRSHPVQAGTVTPSAAAPHGESGQQAEPAVDGTLLPQLQAPSRPPARSLEMPARFRTGASEPARPRRLVTIGLDFGTSGTKVAFRNELERGQPVRVIDFGTQVPGFSRFSYPSTVALEDNRLLVGTAAERSSGVVLRSAKMLLLSRHPSEAGAFTRALQSCDRGLTADDVRAFAVAVMLAAVLRRTRDVLEDVFPGLDEARDVSTNLDVPIDHLHPPAAKARFHLALDTARLMSHTIREDFPMIEAVAAWRSAVERIRLTAIPASERRTHVVPEAIAVLGGIAGFAQPVWGRNYAVVDIGAGTTDVGIFRVVEHHAETRIPFYSAATDTIGGDDLDRAMAGSLVDGGTGDAGLAMKIRSAKGGLAATSGVAISHGGMPLVLTRAHLKQAVASVSSQCRAHFARTFGAAISQDVNTDHWKNLHTVVVGGGSLVEPLRHQFGYPAKHQRFCEMQLVDLASYAQVVPAAVGASTIPPGAADLPFLVAAVGLAVPVALMPQYVGPKEFEANRPVPATSGPYGFDAADMYD